jgi:serine/threonine protein phosphatase PrpC
MELHGITDKGNVRKINQDVCLTHYDEEKNIGLLVVCDGMGGAKAGNVASEMAADSFLEYVSGQLTKESTIIDLTQYMTDAVKSANAAVFEKSQQDADCAGMGTTIVAAAVTATGAVIINVGDSRAYHISHGKIVQITKDHSVVEDMIDRGDLTRSEANNHPNRNLITRALGTSAESEPDFFFLNLMSGDCLLLCSDGLSNVVPEQEILADFLPEKSVKDICDSLVQLAIDNGAPDNVTAAILRR